MADVILYRSTMFFEGRGHGWTETHAFQSPRLDYDNAMGHLRILAADRAALLASPCRIKALRVSREEEKNEAYLEYVNLQGNWKTDNNGVVLAAAPEVCLLLRMSSPGMKFWKHTFLRGIPDLIENDFGEYVPGELPGWAKAVTTYWNRLVAGVAPGNDTYGWVKQAQVAKSNLTRHVVQPDDRVRFEFDADLFPARVLGLKTRVRLTGINGRSNLNGVHVVDVTGPRTCVTTLPLAAVTWKHGGVGTWSEPQFMDYWRGKDMKITRRAPGAPLLLPVGRQKARARI